MTAARLCAAQLARLSSDITQPPYERAAQRVGIVHIGIGAFHRAHQAVYTEAAMTHGDEHWGIAGVSLRSPDVGNALQPQDGLYSVVERDGHSTHVQVIGAVRDVLVAPENPAGVIAALSSPDVQVVTFTVTEKGYYRDSTSGSLLIQAPEIAHELNGGTPRTLFGFLEQGLRRRRSLGLPGLTLLSCDNLPHNGRLLATLMNEFLERRDPALADWARSELRYPSSMVDRIVPATTREDLQNLQHRLGLEDRGAVFTEPFSQWIIEDDFRTRRPRWDAGGAQWTSDVRMFETAKLRMLNGAHSALAYIGLALDFQFVHEAIADPDLHALISRLMCIEAPASFVPAHDQNIEAYATALMRRFANPALNHRLLQIAMDGTQKISQRWLLSIAALLAKGEQPTALLFALAAWIAFVGTPQRPLDDPLASKLIEIRTQDVRAMIAALFGNGGLLSHAWSAPSDVADRLAAHVKNIRTLGMRAALHDLLAALE